MDKILKLLYKYIKYLEVMIAMFLTIAVVIDGIYIMWNFFDQMIKYGINDTVFNDLLVSVFTLIIGVEFIRMLIKPTSDNVLEVILFTVARALILEHSSMTSLMGVLALAILFIIKKYLFMELGANDNLYTTASSLSNFIHKRFSAAQKSSEDEAAATSMPGSPEEG